jgi:hypothetical protein
LLILEFASQGNPDAAYQSEVGTVTAYTSGRVEFEHDADWFKARKYTPYFLFGKLEALDTASEWFRASDGMLYLWAPSGNNPNNRTVEVKRRDIAFDLIDRSYITIEGLNIFAARINSRSLPVTDADSSSSKGILLDRLNAKYVDHDSVYTLYEYENRFSGIVLGGEDSEIRNSTIDGSFGNAIGLHGVNVRAVNNIIRNVNYGNNDSGGIYLSNDLNRASYNTLYNIGGNAIIWREGKRFKIKNNHIYDYNILSSDVGGLYTFGASAYGTDYKDAQGTEIAYNIIHDSRARQSAPDVQFIGGNGIYIDNGTAGYIIHHNVTWNVKTGIILNTPSQDNQVYNNTVNANDQSMTSWPERVTPNNVLKNNIFTGGLSLNGFEPGDEVTSDGTTSSTQMVLDKNIYEGTDPQFVDASANNYQLQASSPARNSGIEIAPYTDGFNESAPDRGAYEYGQTPWKAGADLNSPPPAEVINGLEGQYYDNADFTTLKATRVDANIDYDYGEVPWPSSVASDTASIRWTGKIKPRYSETYTFYTQADDTISLWVNGQQLINQGGYSETTAQIALTANQLYNIRVDYIQQGGGALAKLAWSSSSQAKQAVPQSQLFPPDTSTTVPTATPGSGSTATTVPTSTSTATSAPATSTPTATAAPSSSTLYLSDLNWTSATSGFGQVRKDRSVDNNPIKLNGVTYSKGLGTHAASTIIYNLGSAYSSFQGSVGLDDEMDQYGCGSVVFQVFVDNTKLYESPTMTGNSTTQSFNVSVAGKNELKLILTDAGNGDACDHGDWADARLTSASNTATATATATATQTRTATATATQTRTATATATQTRTATATATQTATSSTGQVVYQVNAGGSAASPYVADAYNNGAGWSWGDGGTINTSGITNPAPNAVYNSARYGGFTYTFPNLTAGQSYTVRLHFAQLGGSPGQTAAAQVFNVAINGTSVLSNWDMGAAVGQYEKALVREFTATANSSGQIIIAFSNGAHNSQVNGIEIRN